jgi:hypothetical protein
MGHLPDVHGRFAVLAALSVEVRCRPTDGTPTDRLIRRVLADHVPSDRFQDVNCPPSRSAQSVVLVAWLARVQSIHLIDEFREVVVVITHGPLPLGAELSRIHDFGVPQFYHTARTLSTPFTIFQLDSFLPLSPQSNDLLMAKAATFGL